MPFPVGVNILPRARLIEMYSGTGSTDLVWRVPKNAEQKYSPSDTTGFSRVVIQF
jgi:hypothetical protein